MTFFPFRRAMILLFCLLIAACGKEVQLPEAKPLQTKPEVLRALPFYVAGEAPVQTIEGLTLEHSDGRELPLRLLVPRDQQGRVPVLVFSHGNWSDRDRYDGLLLHWASHGFLVVAPSHVDGRSMFRGIVNSLRYGQLGLIEERVRDIELVLDQLPRLARDQQLDIDLQKIAVTGHSFGAFTAQQFGGAVAIDGEQKHAAAVRTEVRAVVGISPPGPMFDLITEDSWRELSKPMFLSTGTWDIEPTFFPQWQLHRMAFDNSSHSPAYAVVLEGADHYFGNLICRPERQHEPQYDAFNLLLMSSTLFLDAYLRDSASSKALLRSGQLPDITAEFLQLDYR